MQFILIFHFPPTTCSFCYGCLLPTCFLDPLVFFSSTIFPKFWSPLTLLLLIPPTSVFSRFLIPQSFAPSPPKTTSNPSVLPSIFSLPCVFPHWLLEMAAGYIRPEPSCAVPESAMPGQLFCSVWHTWLGWDLYNNPTLKSPSRSFCFSSSISQQLNCEPVTEPILNCH